MAECLIYYTFSCRVGPHLNTSSLKNCPAKICKTVQSGSPLRFRENKMFRVEPTSLIPLQKHIDCIYLPKTKL
uniref:Uncharacterized protein n=1 Tax=Arundo donax TaxID=35708 RepID=A0A0A9H265_ARUDO